MKSQFIWDKSFDAKPLQLKEEYEGNKEMARTIFVGLADMYGFDSSHVMDHIDCGYDSYRHKLEQFRENYKIGRKRDEENMLRVIEDQTTRFYIKTCLCMNAIKFMTKRNPYTQLHTHINLW